MMGGGVLTAAFAAGGRAGDNVTAVSQTFDGSSLTAGNNINTGRRYGGGTGTTTFGLIFGGASSGGGTTPVAITEAYDGTSWTEVGDLGAARSATIGGAGTGSLALSFGGGPVVTTTEEWDVAARAETVAFD